MTLDFSPEGPLGQRNPPDFRKHCLESMEQDIWSLLQSANLIYSCYRDRPIYMGYPLDSMIAQVMEKIYQEVESTNSSDRDLFDGYPYFSISENELFRRVQYSPTNVINWAIKHDYDLHQALIEGRQPLAKFSCWYDVPLLKEAELVVEKFYSDKTRNYRNDPPKKDEIINWLKDKGYSNPEAEAITLVTRHPDAKRPGRRSNKN